MADFAANQSIQRDVAGETRQLAADAARSAMLLLPTLNIARHAMSYALQAGNKGGVRFRGVPGFTFLPTLIGSGLKPVGDFGNTSVLSSGSGPSIFDEFGSIKSAASQRIKSALTRTPKNNTPKIRSSGPSFGATYFPETSKVLQRTGVAISRVPGLAGGAITKGATLAAGGIGTGAKWAAGGIGAYVGEVATGAMSDLRYGRSPSFTAAPSRASRLLSSLQSQQMSGTSLLGSKIGDIAYAGAFNTVGVASNIGRGALGAARGVGQFGAFVGGGIGGFAMGGAGALSKVPGALYSAVGDGASAFGRDIRARMQMNFDDLHTFRIIAGMRMNSIGSAMRSAGSAIGNNIYGAIDDAINPVRMMGGYGGQLRNPYAFRGQGFQLRGEQISRQLNQIRSGIGNTWTTAIGSALGASPVIGSRISAFGKIPGALYSAGAMVGGKIGGFGSAVGGAIGGFGSAVGGAIGGAISNSLPMSDYRIRQSIMNQRIPGTEFRHGGGGTYGRRFNTGMIGSSFLQPMTVAIGRGARRAARGIGQFGAGVGGGIGAGARHAAQGIGQLGSKIGDIAYAGAFNTVGFGSVASRRIGTGAKWAAGGIGGFAMGAAGALGKIPGALYSAGAMVGKSVGELWSDVGSWIDESTRMPVGKDANIIQSLRHDISKNINWTKARLASRSQRINSSQKTGSNILKSAGSGLKSIGLGIKGVPGMIGAGAGLGMRTLYGGGLLSALGMDPTAAFTISAIASFGPKIAGLALGNKVSTTGITGFLQAFGVSADKMPTALRWLSAGSNSPTSSFARYVPGKVLEQAKAAGATKEAMKALATTGVLKGGAIGLSYKDIIGSGKVDAILQAATKGEHVASARNMILAFEQAASKGKFAATRNAATRGMSGGIDRLLKSSIYDTRISVVSALEKAFGFSDDALTGMLSQKDGIANISKAVGDRLNSNIATSVGARRATMWAARAGSVALGAGLVGMGISAIQSGTKRFRESVLDINRSLRTTEFGGRGAFNNDVLTTERQRSLATMQYLRTGRDFIGQEARLIASQS